jgi:hypothetical protein
MGTGHEAAEASAAITVNGTTAGFITVGDNTPFYVGAQAFLISPTNGQQEVKIVSLGAGGVIGLKAVTRTPYDGTGTPTLHGPNYGQTDMSAFTVAQNWKLFQPRQVVVVPA